MRRKRYFVPTDNNQLRYYRTEDTRQPVLGNTASCLYSLFCYFHCSRSLFSIIYAALMGQNHLVELAPLFFNAVTITRFIAFAGHFTFSLHARKSTLKRTATTSEEGDECPG